MFFFGVQKRLMKDSDEFFNSWITLYFSMSALAKRNVFAQDIKVFDLQVISHD